MSSISAADSCGPAAPGHAAVGIGTSAPQPQRQEDVLLRVEGGHEVEGLEHEPEAVAAIDAWVAAGLVWLFCSILS